MTEEKLKGMVPARYIGGHAVELGAGRTYYHADGTVRLDRTISRGDIIMMPEREIFGQTLLFDPHGVRDPLDLGVGRVVMAEHAELLPERLAEIGYEFHFGRPDFEAIGNPVERSSENSPGVEGSPEGQTEYPHMEESPGAGTEEVG